MQRFVVLFLLACAPRSVLPRALPTEALRLSVNDIAARVPHPANQAWAKDISWALRENKLRVDAPAVCATIAVIGAETGFAWTPGHAPSSGRAGPMQVSTRFATEWADEHGQDLGDALNTQSGGLYFGVARLFYDDAAYDDMRYRFADYHAGVFASRNAAFQRQVSQLTGVSLQEDGDLLTYDARGNPVSTPSPTLVALLPIAPNASRDAQHEKEEAFELTDTWRLVKRAYRQRLGAPDYAVLPSVVLRGLNGAPDRTTEAFVRSAMAHYLRCMEAR